MSHHAWTRRGESWVMLVDDSVDVPVVIVLPDGQKLEASSGDEEWVGYPFRDADGRPWLLSSWANDDDSCEWVLEAGQEAGASD